MTNITTQVTGWLFVAAATMLWLGWVLLPARIDGFFLPRDFGGVLPPSLA